jgi:hypothetical protein
METLAIIAEPLETLKITLNTKPIYAHKVSINKTRGKSIWTANITEGRTTSQMTFTDYNRARSFVRRNIIQVGRYS